MCHIKMYTLIRVTGFLTRSDTNQSVLPQKKAKILKFLVYVEEFYSPFSENKGADQLCSYCTADLRLCFRICRNPFFSWHGSYNVHVFINKCCQMFASALCYNFPSDSCFALSMVW